MKKRLALLLTLTGFLLGGCLRSTSEKEGLGPGEVDKWNDPNFGIIDVGAYNYTDYDIYDVFILPPDKSDIKFAADASGHRAVPHGAERWAYGGGSPNFAWDYRWSIPKKFKVWWLRIVDMKAFTDSGNKYNKYTMKSTEPGAAWCEGEINVEHAPSRDRNSNLIIHYYPDGHIEGDVVSSEGDASKVDIKKRDKLPVLKGRVCLREVPNPYFGKTKPIDMN